MACSPDRKSGQAHMIENVEHGCREEKISYMEPFVPEYDKHESRRILWKIDLRLVPFLALLYLASFLDRTNLGNAKIAGMAADLKLEGHRYNIALTVFFITYALFEVPANIILKMMRPSHWIAIMMLAWGVVMTLTGLVTSYQGLVVARVFLGVAEAGFFPAASFLLTIWYKRYEVQTRMAVFYAACSLSGAFGGLLAFGIEKMDGISGVRGWQWIFILEGLFTVACALPVWFFLPDAPESAKFLTDAEKDFVVNRLMHDEGTGKAQMSNNDKLRWSHVKDAFSDWKIWALMVIYSGVSIGVYGFTSILPTIVNGLGYTSANAQLMTIPIYVAAVICVLVVAFCSDKVQQRTPFIIGMYSVAAIGMIAELVLPQTRLYGVSYFFLFFISCGLYGPYVCIVCLCVNNLAPSSKRAVGIALLVTFGNLGGIVGSNIFIGAQAPKYPAGFGTCLGVLLSAILMTLVLRRALIKENRRREQLVEGKTLEEVRANFTEEEWANLGDRNPFFRYTL